MKLDNTKLDRILESHCAQGENTKNKLLGAAFILVDKDGKSGHV